MTIAFVQSAVAAAPGSASSSASCTLAANPTAGNTIFVLTATSATGTPGTVSGFTEVTGGRNSSFYTNGQGTSFLMQLWMRTVQAGDSKTITFTPGTSAYCWIGAAEYSGLGSNPTISTPSWVEDTSGSSASKTMATLSPAAGKNVLLLCEVYLIPNYNPTNPSGWTSRCRTNAPSPPRCTWDLIEQLVTSASGTYNGTLTGAGGETAWHLGALIVTPTPPGAHSTVAAIIGA